MAEKNGEQWAKAYKEGQSDNTATLTIWKANEAGHWANKLKQKR